MHILAILENLKSTTRGQSGLTLPFALVLTFVFSALVSVSYLFVSVNLMQMQSALYSMQSIAVAEGVNERIKARLNTKFKIQLSPEQEERLKSEEEASEEEEEELEEEELLSVEEEFNEETESYDEYYADEVLKISRYITFREPPEVITESSEPEIEVVALAGTQPEANVEMIGSIDIPRGLVLSKGTMIAIYKNEKINLNLLDIVSEKSTKFQDKLPVPIIKSLTPNFCEPNTRGSFAVIGENLYSTREDINSKIRFNNKDIFIENIKAGPTIEFLIGRDVAVGLYKFYWESSQAEFYVIPPYDGSPKPVIDEIKTTDNKQLIEAKAGGRNILLMIHGRDLFLKKSLPVVLSDTPGITPKIKEHNEKEITLQIDLGRNIEVGIHGLIVATEGGLSNTWLFNVLPPDKPEVIGANFATFTSGLTLLDIRVVEHLLPLIDESEIPSEGKGEKKIFKGEKIEENEKEEELEEELPEDKKLSPFANTDLELVWLLETTSMVGKVSKTVSEVIHRQIPNIHSALTTNGSVTFDGGSFQIVGASIAMTTLTEPTYLSNTTLSVEGPTEEEITSGPLQEEGKSKEVPQVPKSPIELGFTRGGFITVYKEGDRISELDFGVIGNIEGNTIELVPPGLMDFHYERDSVFQFVPTIISNLKIETTEAEKHLVPKDFAITIPNAAMFRDIFRANLEQFAEVADLYTNDPQVPKDEFDLPLGYMGLTYIDTTPIYDKENVLGGKGIVIIDTRNDNQGRPIGEVEISGDSKNPVDFTGIIYVHGNLKIDGSVSINGALIVDNAKKDQVQITNTALGKIAYDERAIKQTLLNIPFTTKPGTVMISNKPINFEGYIESGTEVIKVEKPSAGHRVFEQDKRTQVQEVAKVPETAPEEALIERETPAQEIIPVRPRGLKSAEEELIELF